MSEDSYCPIRKRKQYATLFVSPDDVRKLVLHLELINNDFISDDYRQCCKFTFKIGNIDYTIHLSDD